MDENEIFPISSDSDLIGYHVTAVTCVKNAAVTKVYNICKTVGRNNDVAANKDTAYRLKDKQVSYYINFMSADDSDEDGMPDNNSSTAMTRYIDNNGNGKFDLVLSLTYKYAEITGINILRELSTIEFKITGSTVGLKANEYVGLSNTVVGDRIIYLESNSNINKGIVKRLAPIEGAVTDIRADTVYYNGVGYRYSAIDGTIDTHPGINAINENIGKKALLYAYNGEAFEISPILQAGAKPTFVYVFQIEHVDTLNLWIENITDRSYKCRVIFEDGTDGFYKIARVDGSVLPGNSQTDATPPQGLYSCRINSFGQLELSTVYSTAR
jgi:hypothetical protein